MNEQRGGALGLQASTIERMVAAELRHLDADVDYDLNSKRNGERSTAERSAAIRQALVAPGSHAREALELLPGIEDKADA
jgi:hypothetical protein